MKTITINFLENYLLITELQSVERASFKELTLKKELAKLLDLSSEQLNEAQYEEVEKGFRFNSEWDRQVELSNEQFEFLKKLLVKAEERESLHDGLFEFYKNYIL